MKPLVSIVVVGFDMARELPRTVRSFLPPYQRGVGADQIQIIIADNGSAEPVQRDWFPQDADAKDAAPPGWQPVFVDYLYVSLTAATAFSPTDTMPLTPRTKLLMGLESLLSLLTVGLVAARAVNILGG